MTGGWPGPIALFFNISCRGGPESGSQMRAGSIWDCKGQRGQERHYRGTGRRPATRPGQDPVERPPSPARPLPRVRAHEGAENTPRPPVLSPERKRVAPRSYLRPGRARACCASRHAVRARRPVSPTHLTLRRVLRVSLLGLSRMVGTVLVSGVCLHPPIPDRAQRHLSPEGFCCLRTSIA